MSMNILVVDDERDVQLLFEQRLRHEIKEGSVHIDFAFSGEEAMMYLRNRGIKDILILSDINMPGMSGLDLLQKINNEGFIPPPIIIMITAYQDQEMYTKAKSLGASDYWTKPLNFNLLKEKLKSNT